MSNANRPKLNFSTQPAKSQPDPNTWTGSMNLKLDNSGQFKVSSTGIINNSASKQNTGNVAGMKFNLEDLDILPKRLGEGSQGSVRKVVEKKTGKEFAMKLLSLEKSSREDNKAREIIHEIRTHYTASHPAVIGFYDAFCVHGEVYIVMEYAKYGSLEELIKQTGKIPEETIAKIAIPLLEGMNYLHREKRIVHRDLKPANILINDKGEIKIADFGCSGNIGVTLGATNTYIGSSTYMSPERIRGESYTFNSDIYSIGILLAQCALGNHPYSDTKKRSVFDILQTIMENKVTLPSSQFSPEFIDFIHASTELDHHRRPSASDLLQSPWIQKHRGSTVNFKNFVKTVKIKAREEKRRSKEQQTSNNIN